MFLPVTDDNSFPWEKKKKQTHIEKQQQKQSFTVREFLPIITHGKREISFTVMHKVL